MKISDKSRPKSDLVRSLKKAAKINVAELAERTGFSAIHLNNKLNRNSFKFEDILFIAKACGYSMALRSDATDEEIPLDISDYVSEEKIEHFRVYKTKQIAMLEEQINALLSQKNNLKGGIL